MKTCGKCKENKPLESFYKRGKGRQAWCKKCSVGSRSEWGRNNPDKVQANRLYSMYRLTKETKQEFWDNQNGLCAICDKLLNSVVVHVDHDHVTGKVRGLLCQGCNITLGHYEAIKDHDKISKYLGL